MNTKSKLFINNLARNLVIAGLILSPLMQLNAIRNKPYDYRSGRTIDVINDTYKPRCVVSIITKAEKLGLVKPKARFREVTIDKNGKRRTFFDSSLKNMKNTFTADKAIKIMARNPLSTIVAVGTGAVLVKLAVLKTINKDATKHIFNNISYNKVEAKTARIKEYAKITKENIKESIDNLKSKFKK